MSAVIPEDRADEVFLFPASSGQRRLWLVDQLLPASPVYNIGWRVGLTGPVDEDALERALGGLVARHEALRTRFAAEDGVPVQVVSAALTVPLRRARVADVEAAVREEVGRPFALHEGPLLRATLVRGEDGPAPDGEGGPAPDAAPARGEDGLTPRPSPPRDENGPVLVLVLHHTVADGWSCAVLFDELAHLYAAEVGGEPADLPELPVQYPDYAVWQLEQVDGGAFEADAAHWRRALHGAPTVLSLPADRARPAAPTGRGAELRATLEVPDGSFARLLAVFQCVLHRVTGQADFLVATPVAARTRPETEGLVGFVANTLPLRATITPGTTLGDVVAAAEAATVAALAHQELPFERLVDLVAPQRTLAHAPLVQVMFAVEPVPPPREAGPVTFAPEAVANGGAKFDLSLTVERAPDGWYARWQYDSELFEPATVANLHAIFATAVHADPGDLVAELPLTGGSPQEHAVEVPRETAADLVIGALARDPDRPAIEGFPPHGGPTRGAPAPAGATPGEAASGVSAPRTPTATSLTRGELDRAANRLAHVLLAAGAAPDRPVALCLDRGPAVLVGLLAAWKAGAGYLPLDPTWPAARLTAMATGSEVPVLVTDGAARATTGPLTGPWTEVDLDTADLGSQPDTPPPAVPQHPDGLAYVIHTSGSTGAPKGVRCTQGGLAALLRAMVELTGLGPDDRLASITTPAFDVSAVEMLAPLITGAALVVLPADDVADGALLRTRIAESRATVVQGGPASWRMVVAAGGVPAHVRLRVSGGEAMTRDLADDLQRDGATLVDGYGPTETTVYSAAGAVAPAPGPVRLGPAVRGTSLHVLDPLMRPVPPGVIGELHIGGAGVARGYHGLPGLTADRFRPDPFGTAPGGRLYASGDLVRRHVDGRLEFLGRADRQLKIRGYRIEPGEVEAVLRSHPDVAQAVVVAWSAHAADVRLVAYAVPADPALPDSELRARVRPHLAANLPEYMLPATVVVLAELPRTGTGKVDRDALPEPVWTTEAVERVEPRDDTERRMALIWREVLSLPADAPLGVHDNFFALGGHSLTATQMLARVRTALAADLPLATLFAAPTIAELCANLQRGPAARGPVPLLDQLDELSDEEVDRLLGTMVDDGDLA
ncbi:non-ribosomal peptide synthetase [Saccharothrix syringae]|uniref:Non-ribosomal peptide synthetase n=1 Tax=Saccharothrix syringae TaxID=103733 RepID=A0A5Q0H0U9_SACSY|nr:non-ribosomal peptide synthetase [Saccharothrix syringae]QFZ19886.1 non-ribosomal peptide synthetase [Saccharothrix syringae]